MAWNGLVKKLKRGFGRAVRIGMALAVLGSASCKLPIPTPNNLPTAILSVAPTSGDAPLETIIQLDGADLDGKEDIIEYKIGEDKNNDGDIDDYNETIKASSNPINEKIIFNTSGIKKIYGQVMDSQGAIGKDGPVLVDVASVLAWPPEFDSSLDEEIEKTLSLPNQDKGGNPVSYTSATPLDTDGNGSEEIDVVSFYGNELRLLGKEDITGSYAVELRFRNNEGIENIETLEGIINNLTDVSGQLQDTKTDLGAPGTIEAYSYPNEDVLLGQTQTDSQGNYKLQLDRQVPEFILKARITNYLDSFYRRILFAGAEVQGFRTISFNGEDKLGIIMRAMPSKVLADYEISKQDFYQHVGETNTAVSPEQGLMKWYELPNVEILYINPLGPGGFMPLDQDFLEDKIKNPEDIGRYIEKKILSVQKDTTDSEKHYNVIDREIIPEQGWTIVVPDNTIAGGATSLGGSGIPGYIGNAVIYINSSMVYNDNLVTHEFGHSLTSPYHAQTLSPEDTIMRESGGDLIVPGIADEEQGYIVNEENYKGREYRNNIVGLN